MFPHRILPVSPVRRSATHLPRHAVITLFCAFAVCAVGCIIGLTPVSSQPAMIPVVGPARPAGSGNQSATNGGPLKAPLSQKVPLLDPNRTPYPRSSLYNFASLLEAPAGKHGFLTTRGGHFVWQNGGRARFWGINVANTSLQEPEADIDAII